MIFEGLKLTLLGMGVVYAFLGLLVMVIRLSTRVLKPLTDREQATRGGIAHARKTPRRDQEMEEKRRLLAVISAAIAAHRARAATEQPIATPPVANRAGRIVVAQSPPRRAARGPAYFLVRDPGARLHFQWLRQFKRNV